MLLKNLEKPAVIQVHLWERFMITSNNYKNAVIKTIKAGGCNCSRVNFVGAYFAALKGYKNIPPLG